MTGWGIVKVFLSSTFRDMHAERDHLIKVTFPALREKLLPHRVELYDIDLRWGITEDEAKNEKVVGLCLEQVDECRPFFLAFLGHRYGWVPGQVPQETQQRFPFIRQFPGVSVTELELRHGAMLDPTGMHSLVLLRKEEAVTTIPEATRKRDFQESDPYLQQKLAALKQELEAGPYLVQPYSAVWDPNRYDRVNRTEGKLAQLIDFGKQVEDWLWEAIRKELQLPDTPAAVDPLDAEADLHERFLELRTRIYVGRDDLYRELQTFALTSGETPLLLTGESGLGKSAALSRFVRDFRKEYPDVFVLAHFVGASPRTTSLAGMLQRLTQELQRKFKLTLPKAESPEEIIRTFLVAITNLPEMARVVLVFDALNQLDADSRADSLIWLPERLPPNVRVLCSSATGPQKPPRVLTAFGERKYVNVPLRALSYRERWKMMNRVPKLVAKTLDKKQRRVLLANPATQNPLFLMVALEELRGYGSFERLNEMVAGLPRDGDAVTQLFDQVFERLEEEFNKPLVDWTLRLLASSRRGLRGPELVELTQHLGENADDLYPVLRQLRPYLHARDGLFDFYHTSIRRAVEIRYLRWNTEEDQRDPWARWNPERQPPASEPTEPEVETRHRLITFFETNRLASRSVDELPWQLAQLRSWQRLFDLLGDMTFFDSAWKANEFEVRARWSEIERKSPLRMGDAYKPVLDDPSQYDYGVVSGLFALLGRRGYLEQVRIAQASMLEWVRRHGTEKELAKCLGEQAILLFDGREYDLAFPLFEEHRALCERLGDWSGVGRSLHFQARIMAQRGEAYRALELESEGLTVCRQHNDLKGAAACLSGRARLLAMRGETDAGLAEEEEVEEINRQLNDPVGQAVSLGNQAAFFLLRGDRTRARELLARSQQLQEQWGDWAGLIRNLKTQLEICIQLGDRKEKDHLLARIRTLCESLDNIPRLLDRLRAGERVANEVNNHVTVCLYLGLQVSELYTQGKRREAIDILRLQESMNRQVGDRSGQAQCLGIEAAILDELSEATAALAVLARQRPLLELLGQLSGLSVNVAHQAKLMMQIGDSDSAWLRLQEQQQLAERLHDQRILAICLCRQGELKAESGDLQSALALFRRAQSIYSDLKEFGFAAIAISYEANLYLHEFRDFRSAVQLYERALTLAHLGSRGDLVEQIGHDLAESRNQLVGRAACAVVGCVLGFGLFVGLAVLIIARVTARL